MLKRSASFRTKCYCVASWVIVFVACGNVWVFFFFRNICTHCLSCLYVVMCVPLLLFQRAHKLHKPACVQAIVTNIFCEYKHRMCEQSIFFLILSCTQEDVVCMYVCMDRERYKLGHAPRVSCHRMCSSKIGPLGCALPKALDVNHKSLLIQGFACCPL